MTMGTRMYFKKRYRVQGDRGQYCIRDEVTEMNVPGISYCFRLENAEEGRKLAMDKCREMNLEHDDQLLYAYEVYLYLATKRFH